MSEEVTNSVPEATTTTTVKEETPVKTKPAAKKKAAKKAVKKATKKAPKAKAKKKASKKGGARKGWKKEGLLKPQMTILKALSKQKGSVTLESLSKKCGLTTGCIPFYIGPEDEATRKRHEQKFLKHDSLLTLKLVRIVRHPKKQKDGTYDDEKLGPREFEITALGRKEYEKAEAAEKAKATKGKKAA